MPALAGPPPNPVFLAPSVSGTGGLACGVKPGAGFFSNPFLGSVPEGRGGGTLTGAPGRCSSRRGGVVGPVRAGPPWRCGMAPLGAGLLIWAVGLCSGLGWADLLAWDPGLCSGLVWAGCPCGGRIPGAILASLSLVPACGCGAGPLLSRPGMAAGLLLPAGGGAGGWLPLVSPDCGRIAAGG